jgi:hypothetical protein
LFFKRLPSTLATALAQPRAAIAKKAVQNYIFFRGKTNDSNKNVIFAAFLPNLTS